ncbi:MAG: GvpL/GvpF family gas vesicle protein [Bacillota bacterium]
MEKIYLYCAHAGNNRIDFETSIGGGQIKLDYVTWEGISVIFSMVPADFLSICSRKEFFDWMIVHQQVLNYVYERAKVIPFKVGSSVGKVSNLQTMIESNGRLFKDILKTIQDVDEWNIIVSFSDMQQVLLKAGEAPAVKDLKEEIRKKHCVTREDLIPVGRLIQAVLNNWKKQIADQIIREVKSITDNIFINDTVDESTLLSMSFLSIPAGVDKIIDILNSFPEEADLSVKLVGPMPPHSFYTLEVKSIDKEKLARALNTLGIAGIPAYQEIVKAKRSILHHVHPDSGTVHDNGQVQAVLQSFNLLDIYYRHKNFLVDKFDDDFIVEVVNAPGQAGESNEIRAALAAAFRE